VQHRQVLILVKDTGGSNNGSETNETEQNLQSQTLVKNESNMSGTGGRIILPLPVPSHGTGASPLAPTASRSSTSSGTFDAVGALPNTNAIGAGASVQATQRLSPESSSVTRLPSITADGLLIEGGRRDHSPTSLHRPLDGGIPNSPTSHMSQGGQLTCPQP
jgi:hypothetical protein